MYIHISSFVPGRPGLKTNNGTFSREARIAKSLYCDLSPNLLRSLKDLVQRTGLSVSSGELIHLNGAWYVKHAGLLRLAKRRNCQAIHTELILNSCNATIPKWVFKATVYTTSACKGFTGYGDADPSNCSPVVHGAEMRVAETRAVNRALRKAYGIGICSVEEIGSVALPDSRQQPERKLPKRPAQSSNGKGHNGHENNGNGTRVRDRLCQLIRQHALDAELVKAYAVDFCGTRSLREASRQQVESFVAHLADWAAKDRNALLCQLNSYLSRQQGAA